MSGEELPPGWMRAALGDVVRIEMGQSPDGKATNTMGRGLPLVGGAADLRDGEVVTTRHTDAPTKVSAPGDLILCVRATIGKLAVGREVYCLGRGVAGIRPSAAVEHDFVGHVLVHSTPELAGLGTGSTFVQVDKSTLAEFNIPIPPLNEQHRIVAKLDELRARSRKAREALDEVPALLDKLKQSVLAAALRGDLTAEWRASQPPGSVESASVLLDRIRAERRKRWELANPKKKYVEPEPVNTEGLPELPEGWCWTTLGGVIEGFEAGRSPKAEGRPAGPDEFGVIKVSAMTWGEFDPGENKAMVVGDVPQTGSTVRKGDLLISRANTMALVGAVVLVDRDYPRLMLSDKSLRIRYLPGVDGRFLLWSLRTGPVRAVFESDATGTSDSMRNLSQGKIASAPIALAPAAEQAIVADKLFKASASILSLNGDATQLVADIGSLDRATLARAFRGELVPQDPTDEPAMVLLARIKAQEGSSVKTTRRKHVSPPAKGGSESNMLMRRDVASNHLSAILRERGPMPPETLWKASGMEITEFYDQLKVEDESHLLKETKADRDGTTRLLKVVG